MPRTTAKEHFIIKYASMVQCTKNLAPSGDCFMKVSIARACEFMKHVTKLLQAYGAVDDSYESIYCTLVGLVSYESNYIVATHYIAFA